MKIYKDELVKQLKNIDKSKLTYWLQKYEAHNKEEFLHFNIQGGDLCTTLILKVTNWRKLEHSRKKRGVSYRGAEFTNLKFSIKKDALTTEFIYTTFDAIID